MFTFVRYLKLILSRPKKREANLTTVFTASYRVMPWDIDLNFHLTNAMYPTFLDLARTKWAYEVGTMPMFVKKGWRTVVSSQTIVFIKEIKPFKVFDIETRMLGWDEKYLYTEHRFLIKGQLHAKSITRIAMIYGGKVRPFDQLLKAIDAYNGDPEREYTPPELTLDVKAKKELLEALRYYEQNT